MPDGRAGERSSPSWVYGAWDGFYPLRARDRRIVGADAATGLLFRDRLPVRGCGYKLVSGQSLERGVVVRLVLDFRDQFAMDDAILGV